MSTDGFRIVPTAAVKKGDRVAQMILERICMAPVVEVDSLPETARYGLIVGLIHRR